ncbi:murein hydrolase activator EnvC family protein [Chakrabartyella piscis]|uniref:murein hydrolase activator EnvC family protein n=1 Tax=Chakrabartyella piscis TaxID=2918914 RepID=UPI002958AEC8|nr:peptidoglycan DD-metalloendopeptidase family protein [Chakrabartyella piscis]
MFKLKKLATIALAMVITIGTTSTNFVGAATVAELEAQRTELAAQTAAAKAEIEALETKQASVEEEINAVDAVYRSLQSELTAAETQLNILESNLATAEEQLEQNMVEREEQFELLSARLRYLQEKGSTGYLEILLESESFSDLFLRMQYVNDIMLFDKEALNKLQEIQAQIQEDMEIIDENRAAQADVVSEQQSKVNEMYSLLAEKEALMRSYENDVAKQEEMIAAFESADREVMNLIAQASTSSTPYYTGDGSLGWPVPSKSAASTSLSSGFVQRTNPVTGKWESHSGYDIPASYGAAIVAAEAGKITYSGWMNGYGYTIIIDHGGGLTTLYGHNSALNVSVGDMVSRGQQVAECGSTGMSTGNHCHFSVLENGTYVNPEPYLGVANVSY